MVAVKSVKGAVKSVLMTIKDLVAVKSVKGAVKSVLMTVEMI